MIDAQNKVREFHQTFNITVAQKPQLPSDADMRLRKNLIEEEFIELQTAFDECNIVEIADALGDLLYVVLGTAVTCGIEMQPVFDAIHKSNMTKVGGWVREDGKYMKPDTYVPVDLIPILLEQISKEDDNGTRTV